VIALVRRFFCTLSHHISAHGDTFLQVAFEEVPRDYLARYPEAPVSLAHVFCTHCGAVWAGLTVKTLLKMRVSPWA
jgi:hypothetical protein